MRFEFEKLITRDCEDPAYHLPHIWYSMKRFRRYFCRGWE